MTNAGLFRLWYRVGPFAALGALTIAASTQGCGDETTSAAATTTTTSSSSAAGSGGAGGEGTGGSMGTAGGGTGGSPAAPFMGKVEEAASDAAVFENAYDATPDPKGDVIFFTAVDPMTKQGGVFRVAATAGSKPAIVTVGNGFVAPSGIATSTDGMAIYVADPGWDTKVATPGALVYIPSDGGSPTVVSGTEGYVPQSLDVVQVDGKDFAFFTGIGPDGAGAFKVDVKGGAVGELFKKDASLPVDTLTGITANADGSTVFVTNVDTVGQGHVLEITGGKATEFVGGLSFGSPAGIALLLDGSQVFVSGREAPKNTSAVLRYTVGTKDVLPLNDVINAYNEPAGLHRARGADVFAFVDNQAKGGGAIFVLR